MSAQTAGWLADALVLLHAGVVAFVVGFEAAILLAARRWPIVRNRALRLLHIALMLFIAVQSWLGQLCPLTVWEQALRRRAGEAGYAGGFIEHWVSQSLYVDAPWWVFVAAYTAFAALVAASWAWVRPRPFSFSSR